MACTCRVRTTPHRAHACPPSPGNMMLFDKDGLIKQYTSPEQVVAEFYALRLHYYELRRQALLKAGAACAAAAGPPALPAARTSGRGVQQQSRAVCTLVEMRTPGALGTAASARGAVRRVRAAATRPLGPGTPPRTHVHGCFVHLQAAEADLLRLSNKVRFIKGVIGGSLRVANRKRAEVEADLQSQGFDRLPSKAQVRGRRWWAVAVVDAHCRQRHRGSGAAGACDGSPCCSGAALPARPTHTHPAPTLSPPHACAPQASKAAAAAPSEEEEGAEGAASAPHASYDYLLSMAIFSLTWEKVRSG